jgi:hypothetical protein
MSALDELRSARESLDRILDKRHRPTTEKELDECIEALRELKRACESLPLLPDSTLRAETIELLGVMSASFDEIMSRIRNRPKKEK